MALAKHKYNVLYFHYGPRPSDAQSDDAIQYGPNCMFRNSAVHVIGGGMERCDAVAGDVPRDYARQYPKAVPYIDWLQLRQKATADAEVEPARRPNRVLGAAAPPSTKARAAVELPPPPDPGLAAIPALVDGPEAIELPPPPPDAMDGPATSGLRPSGHGSRRQRAAAATDPRWTGEEAPPPPPPPA